MVSLQPETVNYLASLPTSELTRVLSYMDQSKQIAALLAIRNQPKQFDQASKDIQRKRDERSEAARVVIPPIADPVRRAACLQDPELFLRTYFSAIFYNPFASHHRAMIQAIYDRCYSGGDKAIAAPRGDGKALAIDTSIPTPNGWRQMGELQPGDKVFGGDGKPCNVVAITDVMLDRPCYEVVFADGDRIVADANHEWVVNKRWKESKTIATTKQMHDYGLNVSENGLMQRGR